MDVLIAGRYSLKRRVGGGSFGEIYSGHDIIDNIPVAIKLEPAKTRSPQLEIESRIYRFLEGGICIPKMYFYGTESTGRYNVMVIDYLSLSLEDLMVKMHRPFTLKTVLMLVDQMISCVEFVHRKHFMHRDIKPDNFMMGIDAKKSQVYIIDFGLSKRFEDPRTLKHIKYTEKKDLTGTARYASISAMKGHEQSRRDDLESLCYVWIYLLKGSLPWQGLPAKTQKEKMNRILAVKEETKISDLCEGIPCEFSTFLTEVRNLGFTDEPKYAEYRSMFRDLFISLGYKYDGNYDWSSFVDARTKAPEKQVMALPPEPIPATQPVTAKHSQDGDKNRVSAKHLPAVPHPVQQVPSPVQRPRPMLNPRQRGNIGMARGATRTNPSFAVVDGMHNQVRTALGSPREREKRRLVRKKTIPMIHKPVVVFTEAINV